MRKNSTWFHTPVALKPHFDIERIRGFTHRLDVVSHTKSVDRYVVSHTKAYVVSHTIAFFKLLILKGFPVDFLSVTRARVFNAFKA